MDPRLGAYSNPVVCIAEDNTVNWYYLLRDHLGSITHVVSAESNSVVAEYSYDAWGRMRNTLTWEPYSPGGEPELFVAGRGFTGHEHLPWFNSINMNGRVYDPLSGVFLSPDIYVQNPSSTQSFNRYSYCGNNPLSYSDPSGMLQVPMDFGRASEAYLNWLFDKGMNFSYMGGIGNGGGGWGGYVIGADQDYVGTVLYESNVRFYGYSSDKGHTTYYNNYTGEVSPWDEVYFNYIIPSSNHDPQDVLEILSSLYSNNQPVQESGSDQSNKIIDPCGADKWTLFPNRLQAELYINFNSTCDKEKYFYINTDGTVLVGPWKNNSRTQASGFLDRFLLGNVIFKGTLHKVEYFVHTHPDHPYPSTKKKGKGDSWATEFFENYNIITLIYYKAKYYYYDDNNCLPIIF